MSAVRTLLDDEGRWVEDYADYLLDENEKFDGCVYRWPGPQRRPVNHELPGMKNLQGQTHAPANTMKKDGWTMTTRYKPRVLVWQTS